MGMKASKLQRVLLYALLLPLALLTCIWYLLTVIGSFDSGVAFELSRTGLGPLDAGGVRELSLNGGGGEGGGVGVGRSMSPSVFTTYGAITSFGSKTHVTSYMHYTRVPTSTSWRTNAAGDLTPDWTYKDYSTYYEPTTWTGVGYHTTTDYYTATSTFWPWVTYLKRAAETGAPDPDSDSGPAAAQPSTSRASRDPGPTPAPTPTPAPAPGGGAQRRQPREEARAPPASPGGSSGRHELVKRRRSSGGGGGASVNSEDVQAAFLSHIPNFLGLFWALAVLVWLLVLPCQSAKSVPRSLASMKKTLGWFCVVGAVSTLYTTVAIGVAVGSLGALMWGLWACVLVFAWLLLLALAGVWAWLRVWARANAAGQLYRSIESIEADGPAAGAGAGAGAPGASDPKLDAAGQPGTVPPQLAYAPYPAPTPPTPGSDPYAQPQFAQSPFAYPVAPPPGPPPAGYTYALVPVATPGGTLGAPGAPGAPTVPPATAPSPPPGHAQYPANMYQPPAQQPA